MLLPAADSLLASFVYAIAIFGSTEIMRAIPQTAEPWDIVMLTATFVTVRWYGTTWLDSVAPAGADRRNASGRLVLHGRLHATFGMATDAGWSLLLFVLVQWTVQLLRSTWLMTPSWVTAFLTVETPLFVFSGLLYPFAVAHTPATPSTAPPSAAAAAAAPSAIADNLLTTMNTGIAVFVAATLGSALGPAPSVVEFGLLMLCLPALHTTLQACVMEPWVPRVRARFDLTTAPGDTTADIALKFVAQEKITTLLSIAVFILSSMFVGIIKEWWESTAHWLIATLVFQTLLLLGVASLAAYREADPANTVSTDALTNRALFATALFMADIARSSLLADSSTLDLFVFAALLLGTNSLVADSFLLWRPSDAGGRILKQTVKTSTTTWLTIGSMFIVRMLVDSCAAWIAQNRGAVGPPVIIGNVVLLMVAAVKHSGYDDAPAPTPHASTPPAKTGSVRVAPGGV
jgi:hypothetical protein